MEANEEYVRQRWELVHICDGSYRDYPRGTILLQCERGSWLNFPSMQAAYDFTLQREEQIRLVEEEIQLLSEFQEGLRVNSSHRPIVLQRILARLEAALDELRKGMKP